MWTDYIDYGDVANQLKTRGYALIRNTPQNKLVMLRKNLFKLPEDKKKELSFKCYEYEVGFVDRTDNPEKDNKEFFHMPSHWDHENEYTRLNNLTIELIGFGPHWEFHEYMNYCKYFGDSVIKVLGLKDKYKWFSGINMLRFLKYSPTNGECNAKAHTDRAGLTLITQSAPGLYCFNKSTEEWDKIPVNSGVVMVGDALAKEADLTPTQHKVVLKTEKPRYSTVFFYDKGP